MKAIGERLNRRVFSAVVLSVVLVAVFAPADFPMPIPLPMVATVAYADCPTNAANNVEILIKNGINDNFQSVFFSNDLVKAIAKLNCAVVTNTMYTWTSPTNAAGPELSTITFLANKLGTNWAECKVEGIAKFPANPPCFTPTNIAFSDSNRNWFVVYPQPIILFTRPANGTNLTMQAGTTTNLETKVLWGTNVVTTGSVNFSREPTGLGEFAGQNPASLSTGSAVITFNSSTNGGSGKIIAKATGLKSPFDLNLSLPDVSTNISVNLPKIDLDAMKVSHNAANGELAEDEEETIGAFLPLNNDDDDYSATTTSLGADKDQNGAITGESDLLPIRLHKIDPVTQGGNYTLTIPDNVKIWKNANRSDAVDETTQFPANQDTTLYVEGIVAGSSLIKINWSDGTTTLADCDRIKIAVFSWVGPLNVPEHSKQQYAAAPAGLLPAGAAWIAPTEGQILAGGSGPNDVRILWRAGPKVGKAVYKVSANYIWDLEVNVVKITVQPPPDAFKTGTPVVMVPGPPNFPSILVFSGAPGFDWKARVELSGPLSNGVDQRGVIHITVGFVQNLTFKKIQADYSVNNVKRTLHGNIEGNTYHDVEMDGNVHYDVGVDALFTPSGIRPQDRIKTITTFDTPTALFYSYFKKGNALNPPGDGEVTQINWEDDFDLWVTAKSNQVVNDADQVYSAQAHAAWTFEVNEKPPFQNPLTKSKVRKIHGWVLVPPGATPTLLGGTTANQAFVGITYSE